MYRDRQRDIEKALKRGAREEFGFQMTRIASSKKAYSRCREKSSLRTMFAYSE